MVFTAQWWDQLRTKGGVSQVVRLVGAGVEVVYSHVYGTG